MTDANAVDRWLIDSVLPADPVLERVLGRSAMASLPPIEVSPTSAVLLQLLVRMRGARRVLEIGTLGGFSTIHLARASDDVRVVTIERDPETAEIARGNLELAGVADRVDLRVGQAADVLDDLVADDDDPFDFVFIDADKRSNPLYVERAVQLGRSGTVIVVDNVVRDGAIVDEPVGDATAARDVRGTREALRMLRDDPRLDGTAVQTVGLKGWDGFALAIVR